MKRLACLAVLMALSSPACARDSYSFTVHGHRIRVEADRHCRSLSCVSVSIPGVGNWHNRHGDDDVAAVREPAPAPAPAAALPAPVQPQAQTAPVVPRVVTAPAVVQAQPAPQPALVQATPPAAAPTLAAAPAAIKPVETTSATTPVPAVSPAAPRSQQGPMPAVPAVQPPQAAEPAPATRPRQSTIVERQDKPFVETHATAAQPAMPVAQAAQETETPAADSPLGDWQTEGKNTTLVHIETCGQALCGYVLDAATKAKGESILVNMKPKGDAQWSGNVYSRTSGNSYYGTMTLKQADMLRVEACALGQFLCSGNNWTRVQPKPDEVVTSDHARVDPRS
jgi:uncharacterized protein (DUF2147 family)